jgi:hypothetical protein
VKKYGNLGKWIPTDKIGNNKSRTEKSEIIRAEHGGEIPTKGSIILFAC